MFERFTDRARRVVVLAGEEARMLDHDYIGTEHLLLGLVHEGEGVASKALTKLGIELDKVRAVVEEIIGQGQHPTAGHIPFTPRAKRVLELALREALQLGHNYIGTEHILLGLIREGEGVGAQVLGKFGAELPRVRQQVIQLLQGTKTEPRPFWSPPLEQERKTRIAKEIMAGIQLTEADIQISTSRLARLTQEMKQLKDTSPLDELDRQIAEVRRQKETKIDAQSFDEAIALRDKEKELVAQRGEMEKLVGTAIGTLGVDPQIPDEVFAHFQEHLRYLVPDPFSENAKVYPVLWEGRTITGIDWEHGS